MTDHISNKQPYIKPKLRILCGKPVKDFENTTRPCVRDKNHFGGCNPFSNTPSPADNKIVK